MDSNAFGDLSFFSNKISFKTSSPSLKISNTICLLSELSCFCETVSRFRLSLKIDIDAVAKEIFSFDLLSLNQSRNN